MTIDIDVMARYVQLLTGDAATPIGIIALDDNKERKLKPKQFMGDLNSPWIDELNYMNENGYGIFMYVNELDGVGFKDENVVGVRACFVDCDDGALEVDWHDAEPNFIVESGRGDHGYWLLHEKGTRHWSEMQRRLAIRLGTDPAVCNLSRVMRMPGTLHHKTGKPHEVSLHVAHTATIGYEALSDAYRLHEITDVKPQKADVPPPAPPTNTDAGDTRRPDLLVHRARAYVDTIEPAVEGAHGDNATFRVACILVNDFDLTDDEAWPILCDYNGRCQPPWDLEELEDKLRNARRYGKHSPGSKAAEDRPDMSGSGLGGNSNTDTNPPGADTGPDPDAKTDPRLKIHTMASTLDAFHEAGDRTFIPSFIKSFDKATGGGFAVDAVTTILAYTGCYKSEFARNAAKAADDAGYPVVHVDVELGPLSLSERYLSEEARITPTRIRKRSEWGDVEKQAIFDADQKIRKRNIRQIYPGNGLPLETLEILISKAIPDRAPDEPALIILDSAQRLSHGSSATDARMRVEHFFLWAEDLAKNLHAAVLVIHEQSRTQTGGVPKPGTLLTSGAESRAIEFTTSVLVGLFPDQPDLDDETAVAEDADDEAETPIRVVIGKSRSGGSIGYLPQVMVVHKPYWETTIRERRNAKIDSLLEAMEPGVPYSVKSLRSLVGGRHQTVKAALTQLIESGHVLKAQYSDKPPTFTLRSDI